MSWTGFKKAASRAGTQVMMKTGHVERTTDREYEVEERRYRTLESAALRLQKEAKGYLDSLRAMTASQMRIAETIDAFYGESGAKDGVSRSYKQAVEDLDAETVKALDGPYRTTVLEPINRFCAYFPDINECIKKRNHKMLDYDAMRSKVKKLVEKPDKDPSKLPRTEKEMEMVSMQAPVSEPEENLEILDEDLTVPSPPKVLNKIKHSKVVKEEYDQMPRRLVGISDLHREPSVLPRSRGGSRNVAKMDELIQQSSSLTPSATRDQRANPEMRLAMYGPTTDSCIGSDATRSTSNPRMPLESEGPGMPSYGRYGRTPSLSHTPSCTLAGLYKGHCHHPDDNSIAKTPFFHPSELELLMQPIKQEYLKRQADNYVQAKAAYDQLNEQLTTELPQLIDLRVPYLDPSFEALVKIQLRFCAEAYSRMAQVQQYLDASTRDQYANGDLDARVEDVLGQIRELSIAGTV